MTREQKIQWWKSLTEEQKIALILKHYDIFTAFGDDDDAEFLYNEEHGIENPEPTGCTKEYSPACEDCCFHVFEMVGHPGGSSTHSVPKYECEIGFWKDDF